MPFALFSQHEHAAALHVTPRDGLRDAHRLVAAFPLHRDLPLTCAPPFSMSSTDTTANCARNCGRPAPAPETHLVHAVVHAHALFERKRLAQQGRDQRQGQKAMRDRSAERRLALRPFRVEMYPLVIAGRLGKRSTAGLIDRQPVATTALPDQRPLGRCISECRCWRRAGRLMRLADCAAEHAHPRTVITVSPCWFFASHLVDTTPRSGLLADARLSITAFSPSSCRRRAPA